MSKWQLALIGAGVSLVFGLVSSGVAWVLITVHETDGLVRDFRGDIRVIGRTVENLHSLPMDLDVDGAVNMLAADTMLAGDIAPQAGYEMCMGAAYQAVMDIEKNKPAEAQQRLIDMISYTKRARCEMVSGALKCR